MTKRDDIIVIGAGHNGLTCAALLARAGHRVTVLEARDRVGGMADTDEFASGFKVSACAHFLYHMPFQLIDKLGLVGHGLTMDPRPLQTVALAPDRAPLVIGADSVDGALGEADRESYRGWRSALARLAGPLRALHHKTPPRLTDRTRGDNLALAKLGLDLRRLGRDDMREFLRIVGINVYDLLNESFDDDMLKGALALDAVLGTHMGPRSPNTVYTLLHRLGEGIGNVPGALRQPIGGLGALSAALADSARHAGAGIRLGTRVRRIVVEAGRVRGVELDDGSTLDAPIVVSNADPKTTVMRLLGARHVETGFARRIDRLRAHGNAAKLHLALDTLPDIRGLAREHYTERLVIAPDMDYVERAFNPSKYGEFSAHPVCEISLPTLADPALAPAGQHVLSAIVQYAPAETHARLDAGQRAAFTDAILTTIESVMPGLRKRVLHSQLLTPADLAERYGAHGGHWHHAELALDQSLFVRPVPGAAQYALPVHGAWLCGAGAHPGGHVSGLPGRNAARAILAACRHPAKAAS